MQRESAEEFTARVTGARVVRSAGTGGGCIARATTLELASGGKVFLKHMPDAGEVLAAEARGLMELRGTGTLRVPEVIAQEGDFLLLEHIETRRFTPRAWEALGRGLAALHGFTADTFGLDTDNWIGATPQINHPRPPAGSSWAGFFWTFRLEPQYRRARDAGRGGPALTAHARRIEKDLPERLAPPPFRPALLHGDLWNGNILCDAHETPCLIDPAVYYGHPEAEFGMVTLFGGFDERFHRAYEESRPHAPGFSDRLAYYRLYHLLNHLNLFGEAYLPEVLACR